MFNLGLSEMILIGIIALIFIGPKQLPEIARTIGRMLNEFKRASDDLTSSITNPGNYEKKPHANQKLSEIPLDPQNLDSPLSNEHQKDSTPPESKNVPPVTTGVVKDFHSTEIKEQKDS